MSDAPLGSAVMYVYRNPTITIGGGAGTSIPDNAISTIKLVDGAVTTVKINDGAVTEAKLANNSVGSNQIKDDAVGTSELDDGSVTRAKIADDAVGPDQISGINTDAIAEGNINQYFTVERARNAFSEGDNICIETDGRIIAKFPALEPNSVGSANIKDNSITYEKMADNSVGTDELRADSVTQPKIAPSAVGSTELADDAVTHHKIADAAVRGEHIQGGAVDTAQIAADAVTGDKVNLDADDIPEASTSPTNLYFTNERARNAFTAGTGITIGADGVIRATGGGGGGTVGAGSIGTSELANDSVTEAKMANDSVGSDQIQDGAVDTDQLASDAVTTAKVAAGAITDDELASDAVTNAKVADGAIDTDQLAADAVTKEKIADDSVGPEHLTGIDSDDIPQGVTNRYFSDDLARGAFSAGTNVTISGTGVISSSGSGGGSTPGVNSVDTAQLADGAVTTPKIEDDAVTNAKVADGAIDTDQLAADAVETAKLADGAATRAKIADDAINGDKLADDAVGRAQIADDAIHNEHIANFAVTTNELGDNAVTNAKVADGAIDTDELAADAVTTPKVADDAITQAKIADDAVGPDQISGIDTGDIPEGTTAGDGLYFTDARAREAFSGGTDIDIETDGTINFTGTSGGGGTPADNSITTAMLQDDSVTADKIGNDVALLGVDPGSPWNTLLDIRPDTNLYSGGSSFVAIPNSDISQAVTTAQSDGILYFRASIASLVTDEQPAGFQAQIPVADWLALSEAEAGDAPIDEDGFILSGARAANYDGVPHIIYGGKAANGLLLMARYNGAFLTHLTVKLYNPGFVSFNALPPSDSITTAMLQDGAVTGDKLADDSVDSDAIAAMAVGTSEIVDGAVSADKVGTGAIVESKLGAESVTTGKVSDGAITRAKVGAGAIGPDQISGIDTDDITEAGNQYFTTQRARDAFSAGDNITITDGVIASTGGEGTPATGSPWTTLLEIRPDTNIGDGAGTLAAIANSTFSSLLTADNDDGWIVFKAAVSHIDEDATHTDETPHLFGAFRASEWRLLPEAAAGDLVEDSRVLYATGQLATLTDRRSYVVSLAKGPNNTVLANFDSTDFYLTYLKVELYDPTFTLAGGGGAASATTNTVLVDVDTSTEGVPWLFTSANETVSILPDAFNLSRELTEVDGTSGGLLFVELGMSANSSDPQTGAIAPFSIPVADFLALPAVSEGAAYNITKGFGQQISVHTSGTTNTVRRPLITRAANNKMALGLKSGGGGSTRVTSLKVRLIVPGSGGGSSAPEDNSITTAKLQNGSVTRPKLSASVQAGLGGTPVEDTRAGIVLADQELRKLVWIEAENRWAYVDEFQHVADVPISVTYSQSASLASSLSPFTAYGASLHVINPIIDFTAGSIALASGVTGATLPTTFGGIAQLDTAESTGEWVVWLHTSETFVPTVLNLRNKHGTEYTLHLSRWKTIGDYNVYLSSNVYVASQYNLLGTEEGASGSAVFRIDLKDTDGHSIVAGATDLVRRLVDVPRPSGTTRVNKTRRSAPASGDINIDPDNGDTHVGTDFASSTHALINLVEVTRGIYGLDRSTPEAVTRDMGTVSSAIYDEGDAEVIITDTGTSPLTAASIIRRDNHDPDSKTFSLVPKPATGHPTEEDRLHAGLRVIDNSHGHVTLTDANRGSAFASGWNTLTTAHAPSDIGQMRWDAATRRIKWNLRTADHPDVDDTIIGVRYRLDWHGTLSNGYLRFAIDFNTRLAANTVIDGAVRAGFEEAGIWEIRVQMAGSGDSYVHGAFLHNTAHTGRRWALVVQRVTEADGDAQTKAMQYNAVRHPLNQADGAVVPQNQADHYGFPNVQEMRNLLISDENNEVFIAVVELESDNANSAITRHWLPSPHDDLFVRGVWGIKAEIERIDLGGSRGATEGTYPHIYYQSEQYSEAQVTRYGNPFAVGRNDINARTEHGATQTFMKYAELVLDTDHALELWGTRADGSEMLSDLPQVYWELAARGGKINRYRSIADIPAPKHEGIRVQAAIAEPNLSPRVPRILESVRGFLHDQGLVLRNTGTPSGATDITDWEILAGRIHGITVTRARWQGGALILDYTGRTDLTDSNTYIEVVMPSVGTDDADTTISLGQSSTTGQRFVRITGIDANVQYSPIVLVDIRATDHGVTDDLPVSAEEAYYFI